MSPFFHGSVRPVKKYPRPWSLNPRLNPDLNKDSARMSILGLPSFETGTNLPVFNGLYPKPSRTELSNVDEAVVVSLNGDSHSKVAKIQPQENDVPDTQTAKTTAVTEPSQGTATNEVHSAVVERTHLQPIVEASTAEAPVAESIKEIAPTEPLESAPTRALVPESPIVSAVESLPAESPVVNDFASHGSPGDNSPGSAETASTFTAESAPGLSAAVPAAEVKEVTGAADAHRTDYGGPQLGTVEPVTSPAHSEADVEQAVHPQDVPAEPLPPISEDLMESEEQAHDLGHTELEAHDENTALSGPAGLGPLEVIKEEPTLNDGPVTPVREHSTAGDASQVYRDEAVTNEAHTTSDLTPVDESPETVEEAASSEAPAAVVPEEFGANAASFHEGEATNSEALTPSGLMAVHNTPGDVEEPTASEGPAVDHANVRDGDATSDELATYDDTTPVEETREYTAVKSVAQPSLDRKDSMPIEEATPLETPFETPMERRSIATENSTPFETSFETPMERPFWASGTAMQHETERFSKDNEPAEGPFIPRYSPDQEPATGEGTRTWVETREGLHEAEDILAPSIGTASVAESATNVEPLITDEQLDVSDEFKPGVKIHQADSEN